MMRFSIVGVTGLTACLLLNPVFSADRDGSVKQVRDAGAELTPALTELVRTALANNPRVRVARAAWDAAKARSRAAGQPLYNPELDIDAERGEANSTSLGIRQSIDWADKRSARSGVATQEQLAAQAEWQSVQQVVAIELLTGLASVHTAQALGRLANERAQLMAKFLALAESRQQAGDLTQVELELARLAYTQAILDEARAAARRTEAEQDLVAITGVLPEQVPALPSELPDIAKPLPEAYLPDLPELRVYQARVDAARETVVLRQREQRPDPTVSLRGGQDASDPLVGLTLSIPLHVRNNYRAETQVASAEFIQAESAADDAERRARARFLSAAERYKTTRSAWGAWQANGAPSLDSQMQLLERIWQTGELSTADYLMQVNQGLETRISALELRGDVWRSWFEWLAASGSLPRWLNTEF